MFAKRLLQKALPQHNTQHGNMTSTDLDIKIAVHYGIPYTASILAFDPIQRLLAIGTLDGRIKIIGGDNIEGLLLSTKKLPYKYLEFLSNQGFLVGVSNENDIQVWDLEKRCLAYSLQWEFNITAFSIIHGTYFMYVGDENGLMSVLKYDSDEGKILQLPYHIPSKAVTEVAGFSVSSTSIVGILPQPCTFGNRVLIAYENGLMLWDISENRAIIVRGYADLHLKGDGIADSSSRMGNELQGHASDHEQEEKEICSLCWASSTGSILAVGYIDGDILLWNMSSDSRMKGQQAGKSSNNVVKLQLSSAGRRLPVIVLKWSANGKSNNDRGGHLFIYGGDEIGSEEVLTVLTLDWSSGIETLQCVARMDLTLYGSFADMILIPNNGVTENTPADAAFVLTNPGQLHIYDTSVLSIFGSHEEKTSIQPEKFPTVIPTIDPCITVTKICLLPMDRNSCKALLEKAFAKRTGAKPSPTLSSGVKWPLTGGVPCELSFDKDIGVERIYIAGYQDGSIHIWDATHPILTHIHTFEGEVNDIEPASGSTSVSALDFCSASMNLAVGNESGLVRVYKLHESSGKSSFHFVSKIKHEVHDMHHESDFQCVAVFSVVSSPVRTLQFTSSGGKLAAGFQCGEVSMFDMSSFSVLFHVDCVPGSNSPIIATEVGVIPHINVPIDSPKQSVPRSPNNVVDDVLFVLTKDAHVIIIDSITGDVVSPRSMHPKKESNAISMYVIDGSVASEMATQKYQEQLSQDNSVQNELEQSNSSSVSGVQEVGQQSSTDTSYSGELSSDSLFLLCCEDALWLYSLKTVIQGDNNSIHKVKLSKPCCWSATFKRKDEKACGLILLYQTGVLEIRSLPDLEVLEESSLMSVLRWSFKTNMDKTMSSYDNGHITLVNGSELAFISLLVCGNDFRIPESLPSLHDKVLAAATDAAICLSTCQKKKQGTAPGILGGIIKGFRGGKAEHMPDVPENIPRSSFIQQLEICFSRIPFSDPSTAVTNDEEIDLSIDDLEIDDDSPVASTSSQMDKCDRKEDVEREKLFEGTTVDIKPRPRTREEILTQYKFAGDAAAAAAHARDKLAQRQEKLQRISERTEELQSGAENFASMANELVKTMENKKWWKI